MSDPYALLEQYARQQQELVADNRLDELGAVVVQLERLLATLPERAPEDSRSSLAVAQQALTSGIALLEARLASVREELARAGFERRTRARYSSSLPAPTVDAQG